MPKFLQNVSETAPPEANGNDLRVRPVPPGSRRRILFRGTEPIVLGQRAVALLRLLLERAGAPVGKDALMAAAWPGLAVEDSNLTVQIAALRRVFGGRPAARAGSRRCRAGAIAMSGRPSRPGTAGDRRADAGARAARQALDRGAAVREPERRPEQDYFADGMVDDIITGLSRIKWLFVIARNSTFAYRHGRPT